MELLAARIGSVICYCRPYTPTQKAKIERWFRTLKDQWMASLDMRDFHTLEELRGSLLTYVRSYNQSPHSSLKGLSPQDRFFQDDYSGVLWFIRIFWYKGYGFWTLKLIKLI